MKALRTLLVAALLLGAGAERLSAQCTTYTITVGGGTWDIEIDWELVNDLGVTVASGFAPQTVSVCLPNGCYTMYMYDTFGDGWNGASFVVRVQPANTIVSSGTLANGSFGTAQVNLGGGCGGANCSNYTLTVTGGTFPTEVSWNLVSGVQIVGTGFAPSSQVLCLDTGCFVMQMFDSFGDGWNGATWTLTNSGGTTVGSGTLATGSIGQQVIDLSPTTNCSVNSGPVTASDCPQAVNICTNYAFQIDPNGIGSVNEIPPLGSLGNPDLLLGDLAYSTWGSDNWGCLRNNELNSTWMVINVSGGGSLEFTFGGLGSQAGFYDWIMYPYTPGACAAITANTLAPIRCNWNNVSFGGTGLAATTPPGGDAGNFEPPLNVLAGQQYIICFSNWSSITTLVPLEFGGTATVSCDPIVLPITLTGFTADPADAGIELSWQTSSEEGVRSFLIDHGTGPDAWTTVIEVEATGSVAQETRYAWTHPEPSTGTNYYRLRILHQDGTIATGPTVSAEWSAPLLDVVPNPSTGRFTVACKGSPIQVFDPLGRAVAFDRRPAGPGRSEVVLDRHAQGLHLLVVGEGDGRRTARVLVDRRLTP